MKRAFLQAAKLIHSGEETFSCCAVYRVSGPNLELEYARLASPSESCNLLVVDITQAVQKSPWSQEARDFRVLLLLMIGAAYDDLK